MIQLGPTAEDKRRAREALLGLLAGQTDSQAAGRLADGVAQLDPTAEDKRRAREALLGLLAGQTDSQAAGLDGPARPDSPRSQYLAWLGCPADRRTARCGTPELGTCRLA
jgi:hypothetical protein